MGIIRVQNGPRNYSIELEIHIARGNTELPVEKLNAVFLETSGAHPENKWQIKKLLNSTRRVTHMPDPKHVDIIRRAEKTGTEIWLGDVSVKLSEYLGSALVTSGFTIAGVGVGGIATRKMSRRAALAGMLAGGLLSMNTLLMPAYNLSRAGNAEKRTVSIKATEMFGSIDPLIIARNAIMGHKIQALAEKTGHRNIGVVTGGGHVAIAVLLKRGLALTPQVKRKIASRGEEALKMYRCIYNKKEKQWNVEEHSL